jgi:ESX secretion system ATPase EccB
MLRADPDTPHTPQRRFTIGWVCGLILGMLAVAAVGVYGVISPGGSTSWQQPGALIVEDETGSRYLYLDGKLRPVLNYTSARLIAGGPPTVVKVSANSLRGVPHGLPVGIEAAPDQLPDVKRLAGGFWETCSGTRPDPTGASQPFVTVWVGTAGTGQPLGQSSGLIVRAPKGQVYLAWGGQRLRIPSTDVLGALGYAAATPYPVGWAWLNVLPAGPDLAAPDVPGRGQPGPLVAGAPTGSRRPPPPARRCCSPTRTRARPTSPGTCGRCP